MNTITDKRPALSQAPSAILWLKQFSTKDQKSAANLIDSLLLFNEDDVASSINSQLRAMAKKIKNTGAKAALFVEREYPKSQFFESKQVARRDGKIRIRATGKKGPAAVNPPRGNVRVGSEGLMAMLVSGMVEFTRKSNCNVFFNHPGPDRIRRHRIRFFIIVTDFIGSGERINGILNKMMATPTVRSWRANRWIDFAVVAAAGTQVGIDKLKSHPVRPKLHVNSIVPTLDTFSDQNMVAEWKKLFTSYGPRSARGAGPTGFNEIGAMVAFSYRSPNNVPLILNTESGGWKALFKGPAEDDMRPAFGLNPIKQRVVSATRLLEQHLADDLTETESLIVLVLKTLSGKWRDGQEIALAERTGLTVTEIDQIIREAVRLKYINGDGRLTEAGQKFIRDGSRSECRRPTIPTRSESYYPQTLRVPR